MHKRSFYFYFFNEESEICELRISIDRRSIESSIRINSNWPSFFTSYGHTIVGLNWLRTGLLNFGFVPSAADGQNIDFLFLPVFQFLWGVANILSHFSFDHHLLTLSTLVISITTSLTPLTQSPSQHLAHDSRRAVFAYL